MINIDFINLSSLINLDPVLLDAGFSRFLCSDTTRHALIQWNMDWWQMADRNNCVLVILMILCCRERMAWNSTPYIEQIKTCISSHLTSSFPLTKFEGNLDLQTSYSFFEYLTSSLAAVPNPFSTSWTNNGLWSFPHDSGTFCSIFLSCHRQWQPSLARFLCCRCQQPRYVLPALLCQTWHSFYAPWYCVR